MHNLAFIQYLHESHISKLLELLLWLLQYILLLWMIMSPPFTFLKTMNKFHNHEKIHKQNAFHVVMTSSPITIIVPNENCCFCIAKNNIIQCTCQISQNSFFSIKMNWLGYCIYLNNIFVVNTMWSLVALPYHNRLHQISVFSNIHLFTLTIKRFANMITYKWIKSFVNYFPHIFAEKQISQTRIEGLLFQKVIMKTRITHL